MLYNCNKLSLKYFDELMKQNVWKAFAIIHSGIHHQMKIILRYKFRNNNAGKPLGYHPEKWNIITQKRFFGLLNDLFITGLITKELKEKIEIFNKNRNEKIGHINVYDGTEISDEEIKEICMQGIDIIKDLDKVIQGIFFPK